MLSWIRRKKWLVVNAILVGTLVFLLGIQVVDRQDAVDQSAQIGVGNEKVITLGHIAYAAGSVDYTYDGVDDDIQFQAALDALPATGGRLVDVSAVQKNFGATVTRAIANVTVAGTGAGSYFVNDGGTALFTAGGNNWVFEGLRMDAGSINMGATTEWMWTNVTIGTTYYGYRSLSGSNEFGLTSVLGDNVTRSATFTVASSTSSQQADYVCSGADDQIEIQAAVDALPADGGNIQLLDGNFYFSANVTYNDSSISIEGQGGGTIVWASNGMNDSLFAGSGADRYNCRLANLRIDGNKANQTNGDVINFTGLRNFTIENVSITNAYRYGLYADGYTHSSDSLIITNSSFAACGSDNVRLQSVYAFRIQGSYFLTSVAANGLNLIACGEGSIIGSLFDQNATNGIYTYSSQGITIVGNPYLGANTQYGIQLDHNTYDCIVVGNYLVSNGWGAIITTDNSTDNMIRGNEGHVTENSAVSLGTGAQQTIPHGLSFTPTWQDIGIFSDNTSSAASVYMSAAPDAVNIYVTCNASGSRWHWGTIGK